jgi:hypothetical protein
VKPLSRLFAPFAQALLSTMFAAPRDRDAAKATSGEEDDAEADRDVEVDASKRNGKGQSS